MAKRLVPGWILNLALGAACLAAVAWFWSPAAAALISIDSGSAQVLLRKRLCELHPKANVLVLGNSLAGEGFLVNAFNAKARQHFALNLGVPSAHWFLLERMAAMAREEGMRPAVIVLMTAPEHFSERKDFDFLANDLALAKPILTLSDFERLGAQVSTPLDYANHAPPMLLRPMLYSGELRGAMLSPTAHRRQMETLRTRLATMRADEPMVENGNAFTVCDAGPLGTLAERAPALRASAVPNLADYERILAGYNARAGVPMAVDTRDLRRFRRLLRILRAMAPRVIVAPAVAYDPEFTQYPAAFRAEMARAHAAAAREVPGVELAPTLATDCTDFMDTVHFNRKGAARFTGSILEAVEGLKVIEGAGHDDGL
ncbi:MAG: hypothetical protein IT169_13220 [Bryobacterales bacterium]|nr:hypothetical protein [Bryobacterales bacterium]